MDRYVDAQKSDGGNQTFTKEGAFHSEGSLGRANGPWQWEPQGQIIDTTEKGLMWNDPARLAKQMFKPSGKEFSTIYLKKMTDKA
ncbi:MAG: hypothetical protein HYY67_08860 [Thaumarchaeota archaeon]|nr:hypothetical protein [Nitrososphaerota archaeon]